VASADDGDTLKTPWINPAGPATIPQTRLDGSEFDAPKQPACGTYTLSVQGPCEIVVVGGVGRVVRMPDGIEVKLDPCGGAER
jgi:hypothetical protein